ncbi:MAG: AAA family ATPase [Treponema sp.]|jgi:CO dehydrogenase maturation factor|nr:AAA family ATPase [Treponema sp.]
MNKLIAITGKGGVGKTTVSALLIKNLLASGVSPVLAIDADPNNCLDAALGVTVACTVGRAREDARSSAGANANISTRELLRLKIEQGLVEARGFDLIAMGRPEGEGCYCYANNILKDIIAEISSCYPYVVLDNEAGLENLSRRIVQKVDMLVLVSDSSNAGLQTLIRLFELAAEMKMSYGKLALVINRQRSDTLPGRINEIRAKTSADIVIGLPDDEEIAAFAEKNGNFLEISETNAVYQKIREII